MALSLFPAGRDALGEFAPEFARLDDDVRSDRHSHLLDVLYFTTKVVFFGIFIPVENVYNNYGSTH